MARLTKRQQQAIDTKNTIYTTALRLMEIEGFEQITIERIAKKAGVSVGAFYHYFASKNDILVELFNEADIFFVERIVNAIEGESARDQILSYFHHFANFYSYYGVDIIKALYTTQNQLFSKKDRVIVTLLRDLVSRGFARKELAENMPVDDTVDLLFCTARGVAYKWCVENGGFDLEERMLRFIGQLLKGLRPDCPER